jgi:NADPH:quinone reductase-like Zn-dependent oxidoreductase
MVCLIAAPFEDRAAEFGVRVTTPRIHDRRQVLDAVVDLAARGVLRPQISTRMGLAQAAEAHRRLEANAVTRGRIVLEIPSA